jgi:hypothetical protein
MLKALSHLQDLSILEAQPPENEKERFCAYLGCTF